MNLHKSSKNLNQSVMNDLFKITKETFKTMKKFSKSHMKLKNLFISKEVLKKFTPKTYGQTKSNLLFQKSSKTHLISI